MDTKTIIGIVAVIAVFGVGALAMALNHNHSGTLMSTQPQTQVQAPSGTTGQTHNTNSQQSNSSKVLFSSTQYAQYSYQVYPGSLSQQAKAAMSGFNISYSALQNGSTSISITLQGTGQSQAITLRPGYKLYVVEASFGDDGYTFDSALGDDGFIMVDPSGYLTQ